MRLRPRPQGCVDMLETIHEFLQRVQMALLAPGHLFLAEPDVRFYWAYLAAVPVILLLMKLRGGPEAAEATTKIVDCIRENTKIGLLPLVRECHKRAAHSRGAALCTVLIDVKESSFHFVGVGNIRFQIATVPSEGQPLRISFWPKSSSGQMEIHRLVSNNGTVGYTLPKKLLSFTREYSEGDLIVITTDGREN